MYVFLSRLFTPLVSPLGWSALLWLAALFNLLRRRPQSARRYTLAGIATVLVFSNPIVGDKLLRTLEDDFVPLRADSYPQADAVVVLGGITDLPTPPRVAVHVAEGFDRLLHGLRLMRAGKAPLMVLSGGATTGGMPEAERMRSLALEYHQDSQRIVIEAESRNTHENAVYTTRLLHERGLNRILLTTSASHMRRAAAAFAKQGVEVIPAVTDNAVVPKSLTVQRFLPSELALRHSRRALKEYVGYAVYWLRGWV